MDQANCHTCIYACWDLCQAMQSLNSGFPSRPMCANHPDAPGRMQTTPLGGVCRNYRPKPPTPEGDVKRIPLTGGLYAYVDAADYEWLSQYHWRLYNGGYAGRLEKGKVIFMHREIMQPPEGMVVDHMDGNKANNCRFNLRICTPAENQRNHTKRVDSRSRFKGVGYKKDLDRYWARYEHNGQRMWLGYFDDEVEAARAYDHKAVEYGGLFAWVNLPEEWPPERRQQVYAEHQASLKEEEEKGVKSPKSAKGVKGEKVRKEGGKKRRTSEARVTRDKRRGTELRTEDGGRWGKRTQKDQTAKK